ncbi:MAG: hydrogenase maturation nickel metallochaperone HypA [Candidatus Bipolaricaulota bacterium]
MHEYSVVDELIAQLLPALADHPGRVTRVFLKKGELRILSDRALMNAFEILARGTRLEAAALEIEAVPVRVACTACGYAGGAGHLEDADRHFAVPILACPTCGAEVEVEAGRELFVDRVSLTDDANEDPREP